MSACVPDLVHQQQLVTTLQAVHDSLRKKFRESQEVNSDQEWVKVWKNHTESAESLRIYSKAMQELATEIWEPRNNSAVTVSSDKCKCRLEWVRNKCDIHFGSDRQGEKLKALDVGSCYNPLGKKYGDYFDVTALDLCPAPGSEDLVYVCDFLNVNLGDPPGVMVVEGRKIVSLKTATFDIVVFSFFLEYLPDPKQRVESCRRALKLLKEGGLLFILRPDSNSPTESNVRQIKQLKVGLGLIGFKRVFCEKLKHLWCTAYMKLGVMEAAEYLTSLRFQTDLKKVNFSGDVQEIHWLFSIPQDFRILKEKSKSEITPDGCDTLLFQELPQFNSD